MIHMSELLVAYLVFHNLQIANIFSLVLIGVFSFIQVPNGAAGHYLLGLVYRLFLFPLSPLCYQILNVDSFLKLSLHDFNLPNKCKRDCR